MRKPVVDYRECRLNKINEPRFSHLKLLLGWVIYFALYFIITPDACLAPHQWQKIWSVIL